MKTKLSGGEADAMIKFACRPPPANAESITTSARNLLALDNKLLVSLGDWSVCASYAQDC